MAIAQILLENDAPALRKLILFAWLLSDRLGHSSIGTEHLVLAFAYEFKEGRIYRAFQVHHASRLDLISEINHWHGLEDPSDGGTGIDETEILSHRASIKKLELETDIKSILFTPLAQHVLELALKEASSQPVLVLEKCILEANEGLGYKALKNIGMITPVVAMLSS